MFSKEEYQNRINRIAAEMSAKGIDALVVLDDEHLMTGGNVGYLTNFYHNFCFPKPQSAAVVVPPNVYLCIHPGFFKSSFRLAEIDSVWVKDVFGGGQGLWGINLGKDIKDALEKAKQMNGKVGIDGLKFMPESVSRVIREELKGVNLIEDTGIVEKVRMIKSSPEMEVIREASKIADMGVTAWMNAIKAGDPQYISVITGEQASRMAGAEESVMFMGAGVPWIYGKYRGSQIYKTGDMANTEFNARLHGYYGQVNRTVIIGKPSDKQKKMWDVAIDSYRAMAAKVKPGITASEIYAAGEIIIKKAGFSMPGMRLGHGMGLTIAEGFNFDERDHRVMQPGFYIMIHNIIPIPEEGICVSLGNALLVTEKGSEELNKAEFRMQV